MTTGPSSCHCLQVQTHSQGVSHPLPWLFWDREQKLVLSEKLFPLLVHRSPSPPFPFLAHRSPSAPALLWDVQEGARLCWAQQPARCSGFSCQLFCSWKSAGSSSSAFSAGNDQERMEFAGTDSGVFTKPRCLLPWRQPRKHVKTGV